MATKIKETPVLYGKYADHFLATIWKPKKYSNDELIRMKSNYEKIIAISKL